MARKIKPKWNESWLIMNSLAFGGLLSFVGIFISSIWGITWLTNNAVNFIFVAVGIGLIIMSKVFDDRGKYLVKTLGDGTLNESDITLISLVVLGLVSLTVGVLDFAGLLAVKSQLRAMVSGTTLLFLTIAWIGTLKREIRAWKK